MNLSDIEKSIINTEKTLNELLTKVEQIAKQRVTQSREEIPPFCSVEYFLSLAGITRPTFAKKRRNGEIEVSVKGNRVYVSREEAIRYLSTSEGKFAPKRQKITKK